MVAVDKGREIRGNNLTVAHDSLMAHGFIFGLFASPNMKCIKENNGREIFFRRAGVLRKFN